jgi:hypothetical protein
VADFYLYSVPTVIQELSCYPTGNKLTAITFHILQPPSSIWKKFVHTFL